MMLICFVWLSCRVWLDLSARCLCQSWIFASVEYRDLSSSSWLVTEG